MSLIPEWDKTGQHSHMSYFLTLKQTHSGNNDKMTGSWWKI